MGKSIYSIKPIKQNDIKYLLVVLKEGPDCDEFSLKMEENKSIDRVFELEFMNSYNVWQHLKEKERMPWSPSLVSELQLKLEKYKTCRKAIGGWY